MSFFDILASLQSDQSLGGAALGGSGGMHFLPSPPAYIAIQTLPDLVVVDSEAAERRAQLELANEQRTRSRHLARLQAEYGQPCAYRRHHMVRIENRCLHVDRDQVILCWHGPALVQRCLSLAPYGFPPVHATGRAQRGGRNGPGGGSPGSVVRTQRAGCTMDSSSPAVHNKKCLATSLCFLRRGSSPPMPPLVCQFLSLSFFLSLSLLPPSPQMMSPIQAPI